MSCNFHFYSESFLSFLHAFCVPRFLISTWLYVFSNLFHKFIEKNSLWPQNVLAFLWQVNFLRFLLLNRDTQRIIKNNNFHKETPAVADKKIVSTWKNLLHERESREIVFKKILTNLHDATDTGSQKIGIVINYIRIFHNLSCMHTHR